MVNGKSEIKRLGYLAYPETPEGWDVRRHIICRGWHCNGKVKSITFDHPSGDVCTEWLAPELKWSPFDEINVVVRFGSYSMEHADFLRSKGVDPGFRVDE